jgi:hypothetical protein|tara:strand:+ start:1663 stop:1884 length:222 start_codon:yes stop_codon:yes gene_type:complete
MNMTNDKTKDTLEIDVNDIPLDELIIAIGGVLFSGAELQEIDTVLLTKLIDLLENEINLRELGMDMPTDETVH